MLEMEMKFPVEDFGPIEKHLRKLEARRGADLDEADHYYNAPDRDFARTDEALRLRRVGSSNVVTYKGPKHAGPVKTRTEIEVAVEPGDEAAETFCRLLTHLGYHAVAVVRKHRALYDLHLEGFPLQVCLDDVEMVGRFLEIEIVAEDTKRQDAERVVLDLAGKLGLKEPEKRSYLEMLLTRK